MSRITDGRGSAWVRLSEYGGSGFRIEKANPEFYVNELRERAGFPENSISTLTMEILRKERRVELAFEDHRYFDLKRWRLADQVWNGIESDDTRVRGLYPYRVVRPGHEDNGKFIFEKMTYRFKKARYFQMKNYYASIAQDVLDNNPKIVKNPFHN